MGKKLIAFLIFCTFWGLLNSTYAAFSWEDNIVAHYKMNDNEPNTTVVDSQGYSDGTAQQNTSVLHTDGKVGGALTFNFGVTDYILISGQTNFPVGDSKRSISFWSILPNDDSEGTIFSYGLRTNRFDIIMLDYMSSLDIGLNGDDPIHSCGNIWSYDDENPWMHTVVTYDQTYIKVYLNNSVIKTLTKGVDFPALNTVLDEYASIGSDPLGAGSPLRPFKAETTVALDNIMIFNKALTEDEVAELYNSGNGIEDIYDIAGQVILYGGSADITDVLLTLSGDANETTNPDADGNFSFLLTETGNYVVTPSLEDYYFFPTFYSYSPLDADQTGQNFIGLHEDYDSDGDGMLDWHEILFTGSIDDEGGGEGRKNCFIAIACYGTPMAEEVRILSQFKDKYLLTNPIGEGFVNTYCKISPPIASFIIRHQILKKIVGKALFPLTWLAGEITDKN